MTFMAGIFSVRFFGASGNIPFSSFAMHWPFVHLVFSRRRKQVDKKRIAIEQPESCMVFDVSVGEDSVVLDRYLTDDLEKVVLPEEVYGKPVTEIGPGCFFNHPEITEVVFPETLTKIGESAFALCKGLRNLLLPDSVSDIGVHAFRECTGLRKIVMPSSLKCMKVGIFSYCYLPDNVEITLKEGLEKIDHGVFFSSDVHLHFPLRLPESVSSIAEGAFEPGMKILTSLPYNAKWFEK